VSHTALTARKRTAEALERKRETEQLYELGQAMLASESLETTVWLAINRVIGIFDCAGTAFYLQAGGEVHRVGESSALTDDALRQVASSRSIVRDPAARMSIVPVRTGTELVGSLGMRGVELSETVLKSISNLLSVVMERVRASEKLLAANRELEQKHQQVEQQKRVSESLLLNILPSEVADELRVKGIVS